MDYGWKIPESEVVEMGSEHDMQLEQFALRHARKRLDYFAQYLPDVREVHDVEDVHQLRVGWRRFRATVRLFNEVLPTGSVRRVQKGASKLLDRAGDARDLDVQILALEQLIPQIDDLALRAGPRRLCLRLKQARQKNQPRLAKAADQLLDSDLVGKLQRKLNARQEKLPTGLLDNPEAAVAIWQHAWLNMDVRMEAVHSFQPWLADPGATEQHHAMRSEVRKLRYAAEMFATLLEGRMDPFIDELKQLQEHLGTMHDCDVWLHATLPTFVVHERRRTVKYFGYPRGFARLQRGIEAFSKDRAAQRQRSYEALIDHWRRLHDQGYWARFRQLLLELREKSHQEAEG